ncbi:MAG TPA: hypothetical protein VGC65_07760 [Bacteroidia bacterium]
MMGTVSSCKTEAGHNKYKEAKVRPSQKQLKADKKHNKRAAKGYEKQMQKNRKHLFGSKRDPGAPRKRK